MKTRKHLLLVALLAVAGLSVTAARADGYPPYYSELLDHGVWFTLSGDWVWQPRVVQSDRAWRPYFTAGNWRRENNAWFWASDYVWGPIVFHHGRWYASPANGWVWVPGTDWSPAWVSWRIADDVCGWAPQPPGAEFFARISAQGYELSWSHFAFVPARRFLARDLAKHAVDGSWYGQRSQSVVHGPAPAMVGYVESFSVAGTYESTTETWGAPVVVYPQQTYIYPQPYIYPRSYIYPRPGRVYRSPYHERRPPPRHDGIVSPPVHVRPPVQTRPQVRPGVEVRGHPQVHASPRAQPKAAPARPPAVLPRPAPSAPMRSPIRTAPAGAAGRGR
jgi:hypothetical protein